MSDAVSRRRFLARSIALLGGVFLAGCDRLSHSQWFTRMLAVAESLNRAARNATNSPLAMAQEFTEADLSPSFRSNGTSSPSSSEYHKLAAGQFADYQPPGLIVLHPPTEIRPTLPEYDEVASGCVLLPGIPHLGLDHRAAWVEADHRGNITSMISRAGINLLDDADTAVLALFLAA